MELITKKVPKRIVHKIRRLQAKYQLMHNSRISEAEIIEKGIEKLEEGDFAGKPAHSYSIEDIFGIVKGGKPGHARYDVDEVVYYDEIDSQLKGHRMRLAKAKGAKTA